MKFRTRLKILLNNTLYLAALLNIYFLVNYSSIEGYEVSHIYSRAILGLLVLAMLNAIDYRKLFTGRNYKILPDLFFILIGIFITGSDRMIQFYILGRQSFVLIKHNTTTDQKVSYFDRLSENSAVFVMLSFLFTIFVGTLLLLLPAATTVSKTTSLLGALFTSTSSTCVTGLIVYDTGTHFTLFGQLIILSLIQIGGLGIMTISSAFAIILGQKLKIKSENLIQNVVGESNKIDMISLLKGVLIVTVIFELLGAVLLYMTFHGRFASVPRAVYYSVFHSVSAFCNAGFSLFADSFVGYRSNLNINFVITTLIILGGIGFPVMVDIRKNFFRNFKFGRLSLHTKIVLITTLTLIIIGVIGYFFAEYNNCMKNFKFPDRIAASYFQSVTTRTAGFNTIDNAQLSQSSVFLSILLMFIGASPGSTGGGIKTTTFAIIIITVLAMLQGSKDINFFHRKVSKKIIRETIALIALSFIFLSLMIFILLQTENIGFARTIFEAVSAFGTVGLSMNATMSLTSIGQFVIILLMYIGRVGPLTLIFAISERKLKTSYTFIEEKISIG